MTQRRDVRLTRIRADRRSDEADRQDNKPKRRFCSVLLVFWCVRVVRISCPPFLFFLRAQATTQQEGRHGNAVVRKNLQSRCKRTATRQHQRDNSNSNRIRSNNEYNCSYCKCFFNSISNKEGTKEDTIGQKQRKGSQGVNLFNNNSNNNNSNVQD